MNLHRGSYVKAIADERGRRAGIAKLHNENHSDEYHDCELAIAERIETPE